MKDEKWKMRNMSHLSPEEFVDALDGTAAAATQAHLRECEQCRQELAAFESIEVEARSISAPEPSPLFWDHFSARVARATAEVPATRAWWNPGWRVAAAVAASAIVVTLAVVMRPSETKLDESSLVASTESTPELEDDGTWSLVLGLASDVAWDELREAAAPAVGSADVAIAELDAVQRDALVRLLKQEIGEP